MPARISRYVACLWIKLVPAALLVAGIVLPGRADDHSGPNAGTQTPPLTPPEQAAADITVPPGFHVSLFASEPVIRQPIGMATDARGRLWVAENNTYSDAQDRIST